MNKLILCSLILSWIHIYIGKIPLYGFVLYPTFLIALFYQTSKIDLIVIFSSIIIILITLINDEVSLGALEMYLFLGVQMSLYGKIGLSSLKKLRTVHLCVMGFLLMTVLLQYLGLFDLERQFILTGEAKVALSAQSMGRYVGVFGSPFEAGVAFGLFGIAISQRKNFYLIILYFLGVFTVSKAYFISLPFVGFKFLPTIGGAKLGSGVKIVVFSAAGLYFIFGVLGKLDWVGYERLKNELVYNFSDGMTLETLTAKRYGSFNSTVGSRFEGLNPFLPKGFCDPEYPLDSQYLYLLYTCGIYGLPMIFILTSSLYRQDRSVLLFLILVGLGSPVLFKNYIAQFVVLHFVSFTKTNVVPLKGGKRENM